MHRTVKPKLHASPGVQSCGGVQMQQASGVSPEVRIDLLVFQTLFQFLDKANHSFDPSHFGFTFDLILAMLV